MTVPAVVVVGSTNIDLIMQVSSLPAPGETVGDAVFSQALGGKGANQAIAAVRSGASTAFISSVGDDDYGRQACSAFSADNLDISGVALDSAPTGTALIFVDQKGENCIGVAPGANACCSVEQVTREQRKIREAAVVLLQLEIPYDTVRAVLSDGSDARKVLNAAPARRIPSADLALIDTLVVNHAELYQVLGESVDSTATVDPEQLESRCSRLRDFGVTEVVVTLGKEGVYLSCEQQRRHFAGFAVAVTDTTGAGDTFCGALAARLASGDAVSEAIQFAQASAALACTGLGAQTAIPNVSSVRAFLDAL